MSAILNDEVKRVWEEKAAWWDGLMGDAGNEFHRTVVQPPLERLLDLRPGERVLEIACGSGLAARRLAALGAEVTATDMTEAFLERARARSAALAPEVAARIRYVNVDATDEAALRGLGEGAYDAVISTMALMDMAEIAPLFRAVARLLAPGGRCVMVTAHPAFNDGHQVRVAEMVDEAGRVSVRHALKVWAYAEPRVEQGAGAPGEPIPHYYFHRSLADLLGPAFAAGLVLDALEEPCYPEGLVTPATSPFSWAHYTDIPQTLAFRLRAGA